MAEANSVTFNFNRVGEIAVEGISEDDAFEAAMDSGAQDVAPFDGEEGSPGGYKIITHVADFGFSANEAIYDRCLELEDVDAIFTTGADVGRNK